MSYDLFSTAVNSAEVAVSIPLEQGNVLRLNVGIMKILS